MKGTIIFTVVICAIVCLLYALAACNYNKKSKKENVLTDTINLHIGDKLFVEVTENSDHKVNLKLVDAIKDSAITLKISFTYQLIQGNVGYCSVLQIYNPRSETIVCKSSMKRTTETTFEGPVIRKITPVHTCNIWSFKIENIILTDFKFE